MQPARGRFAQFDLDRQIASTFPAHWKVGPAPVFWASQPLEPAEWLALLILKAGDVESNPGPQNRKLPHSALTTQTTTLNSTTHSHATTSHPNKKLLTLLQLNINSITNKHEELKLLVTELQPDIITIQETKLKKHNKTPQIPTYSAICTDRANGKGGGLLTYIKHNITFSDTKIPNFINPINTELQIIQLHITHKKIYTIANIYIPPRNTTSPDHATCDADITSCIQYITNLPNSIISGDINAHSPIWHSHTTDHRGDLIADLLGNSDHITLNTNTHTRLPFAANQRPTSPDITSITTNLYNRTHWETLNALNSDHLPILTTINTRTNFRLQQNRQTYTNYNKANWQNFTTETESSFRNINPPSDTHTANKILTNIILNADKHNIPKGKIQHNCKLLPEDIRTKINTRNNIRKHNPLDPNLAQLNKEITSDKQHHKTALWKSHLDGNWDHRENTHTLWKTLKNLSNKNMHTNKNHTISFNNKPSVTSTQIANSFNKQFTNTVPHTSNKTNRKIDKQVHKLPKTTFILTTSEISAAIRNSKNNNSTGPDGISIRHLKHIGPLGLTYLTNSFNLALNTNTIPHMWKLANIIPIPKPDKDHNTGTSFRPISLLSVISKTLEKALLPYITNNIPQHHTQHGFKAKHSTTTALHNINNTIASGFNQRIPPARTIAVALDMSKAFDTVNIHTLTKKLLDTQIPPILIKFIANYIKGRKAFTTYNNKTSTQRQFKTGVPQGGVLSPTLFNIYTSDIPSPPPNINITVYADDITMTSTDTNKQIAQAKLQPYLQEIASWTQQNQLHHNPDKTTSTLFTPDPAEYSTQLTLNIDNVVIPTVKNPKILGLTFDPKLTYNSHIRKTSDKARNTLKLLKALTSTKWGKQKETIVATYKAIIRPILEYASTIWSPIASTTGITKLQTIQNMALRIATGCTSDTNIQHLHNETNILPLNAHLKLHSSQLRQKSQHPTHPLHKFTVLTENERHKKQTIFDNNNNYTVNINTKSDLICEDLIQSNLKLIHSHIVSNHLSQRPPNKVLQDQTPSVSPAELLLSRETRRTLAQLRTNKSPLLVSYLFSIGDPRHPSPLCPLCLMHDHTSSHLFECKSLPTSLSSLDLWTNPDKVEPFLATWGERLLAAT